MNSPSRDFLSRKPAVYPAVYQWTQKNKGNQDKQTKNVAELMPPYKINKSGNLWILHVDINYKWDIGIPIHFCLPCNIKEMYIHLSKP